MVLQSMPYNPSIDFAAQMLVEINQAEFHSIEQLLANVEVVAKLGLQRIVRVALLWVRKVIIVVSSIILQSYVEKKNQIKQEIFVKTLASIM